MQMCKEYRTSKGFGKKDKEDKPECNFETGTFGKQAKNSKNLNNFSGTSRQC